MVKYYVTNSGKIRGFKNLISNDSVSTGMLRDKKVNFTEHVGYERSCPKLKYKNPFFI